MEGGNNYMVNNQMINGKKQIYNQRIQKHLNDIYPLNTKDAEMDSMTDSLKQEDM